MTVGPRSSAKRGQTVLFPALSVEGSMFFSPANLISAAREKAKGKGGLRGRQRRRRLVAAAVGGKVIGSPPAHTPSLSPPL